MYSFSQSPTIQELSDYSEYLYRAISTKAKFLEFRKVRLRNGMPVAKDCHGNVNTYVEENQQFTPVYGWLVVDSPLSPQCLFLAHSAVRDPSGELFEITPIASTEPRQFIEALLTDAEFEMVFEWLLKLSKETTLAYNKQV